MSAGALPYLKVTKLSLCGHCRFIVICYDKTIRGGDVYGNIESREPDENLRKRGK